MVQHKLAVKILCIALGVGMLLPQETGATSLSNTRSAPMQTLGNRLLPPGPAPARNLKVVDMSGYPSTLALTMTSLQGIVNQKQPRIFMLSGRYDRMWAEWLKTRGDVDQLTYVNNLDAFKLISEFRDELKGQVVVDPDVPASINVATMLAGLKGLLITYPQFADTYVERYNLPIVEDLRGRFEYNSDAYKWAYDNLWSQLNHHALGFLHPECAPSRDFLIQQQLWVWWQPNANETTNFARRLDEMRVTLSVLKNSPMNIPVLGYPWHGDGVGLGEHQGVSLLSEYGKFLLPADYASNLSVHAAAGRVQAPLNPPDAVTQKPEPDKLYASIIFSDGDNLQALLNYFPQYWEEPQVRDIPVGWSISPAVLDFMPDVVDYLVKHRLPGDYFVAAVSGVGYAYIEKYGTSLEGGQDAAIKGFMSLTNEYMAGLGMTIIWPMSSSGALKQETLRLYADQIPVLRGLFPDYGKQIRNLSEANYMFDLGDHQVPVFHATGTGAKNTADDIRRFFAEAPRPAFTHAFLLNWNFNALELAEMGKTLSGDIKLVTPGELVELYKAAQ